MFKKNLRPLLVVAVLAVALAWLIRRDTGAPPDHSEAASPNEASVEVNPGPRARAEGKVVDLGRVNLCGQIGNYDPTTGPAIVAVAVALPGTAHPTRTARVAPDGRWELSAVPVAPLQVAVTATGAPATSLYIAEPAPCTEQTYRIELTKGPATAIRGTVSDVFGGPLAHAQVEVIPIGHHNGLGFRQPVFRAMSADDGSFTMTVPANEYAVRSSFPGYTSKSARADTTTRELVEVDLVLDPGAIVSGRVVRASDGSVVPHAELRLVALADAGGGTVNHVAPADAVSGPDGSFVVENVGPGSWAIYAKTDDAISSKPTEIAIELFADRRDVEVVVEAAPRVHGLVRERHTEQPVSGALVLLQSEVQSLSCSLTDGEGMFDCGAVPLGTYTAVVAHEDHAGNLLGASVRVGSEPRYLELAVERGHTVAGRVSPPVAGVPIRVRMDLDSSKLDNVGFTMMNAFRSAKTDANGDFRIGPLSLGEVTLVAEHLEHGRGEARVDQSRASSGDEVEIVMSEAGALVGRVVNLGATDGTSLEVILTPIEEPMRIDGVRQAGAPMYTVAVAKRGDFEAKGLEPGRYSLRLQHSRGSVGFTGPEHLELLEAAPTRVELELLGQQRMFAGVVVDQQDEPVEGAVIYLPDDSSTRALSESSGEFSLAAWSDADAVEVRYHRAGYSTATSVANLRADTHNRLVVAGVSSLAVKHPEVSSGRLILTGKTRMDRVASPTGSSVISGLLEGQYQVHVCGSEGYGHGEIDLGEDEAELRVDTQPWVEIHGVALGPEGDALVAAQILAAPTHDPCGVFRATAMSGLAEGLPVTDDIGGFVLSGLPPGPALIYIIDIAADPPRELSLAIEIPRGTSHHDLGELRL